MVQYVDQWLSYGGSVLNKRFPFEQVQWRLSCTNFVTWEYEDIRTELVALSDLERGTLLGPVWREHFYPKNRKKFQWMLDGLERVERNGRFTAPLFDGAAADEALSALVTYLEKPPPKLIEDHCKDTPWTPQEKWISHIGNSMEMVCSQLIEEPGPVGRAALSKWLQKADVTYLPSEAYLPSKLVAARLSGEGEIERNTISELHKKAETPIAIAEIDAVLTAPPLQWTLLLNELFGDVIKTALWGENQRDARLSDLSAYRAFSRDAIKFGLERVRAVQSGKDQYQADKLMSKPDACAVARALKLTLAEDPLWELASLEKIWRGAAFAPNPKAKTLPSQTLTYQIGKAVIDEPRPEAVMLMTDIARDVRHAGVKKRLSKYAKQAFSELQQQPERVLDVTMEGPVSSDIAKLLKPALEGLLLRDWDIDARHWASQMMEASLWPLTSKLIWVVDGTAVMPKRHKAEISWATCRGEKVGFDNSQKIRLWHSIEVTEVERKQWRETIANQGIAQPFSQAYRELYLLPEHEMQTSETSIFKGHMVAQVPMIGLARRSGFKLGFHDEIDLRIGGQNFRFQSGIRTYPGAGGEGTTGTICLLGPARSFAEVSPRVLNEAFRKFDLIIAVGTAGVVDSLPQKHPDTFETIWPGSQSMEMRRALLGFSRPKVKIEGRWVWLNDGVHVHLGTGRIYRDGTPIELPQKVRPKATPRADDPIMDRIWKAVEVFGLE